MDLKIKTSVNVVRKKGISHILDDNKRVRKYKPWLGDLFAFLYDRIMEKSVFPKKFNASFDKHYKILKRIFEGLSNKTIIEFATGSGDAVKFLNNKNIYAGVDISAGLLRIAKKKFDNNLFLHCELYVSDACDTPFEDNTFDVAVCNLSLNFFQNIEDFISELERILKTGGIFYCSVPVPERKKSKSVIHGNLYTLENLKKRFEDKNFILEPFPDENGAILYFEARLGD